MSFAPMIDGENYGFWTIRMTTIFNSYDLWDIVQYSYELPEVEVDATVKDFTTTQKAALQENGMNDATTLGIIQGLSQIWCFP